jgi:Transposase IS66 family
MKNLEPNSNLGRALQYWLSHWVELTVWLREPGTPIDNNEAERAGWPESLCRVVPHQIPYIQNHFTTPHARQSAEC